jgi:hypothetical protein
MWGKRRRKSRQSIQKARKEVEFGLPTSAFYQKKVFMLHYP